MGKKPGPYDIIDASQSKFQELAHTHNAVSFERECYFAKEALAKNNYLEKIAAGNPASLKAAILNVASCGITLNPVQKHAYLVPRDGRICLDVSYMGLVYLACDTGAIRWVQCDLVYEADNFSLGAPGEKPTIESNPFKKDKGDLVGVYCVAKTSDGDYLTHVMQIDDVYSIRDRSQSYKAGKKSPWNTDTKEMIKKTCVKQASKLWPKTKRSDRLETAIDAINDHEGINFNEKEKPEPHESVKNVDIERRDEQVKRAGELVNQVCEGLSSQAAGRAIYELCGVTDLEQLKRKQNDELDSIIERLELQVKENEGK